MLLVNRLVSFRSRKQVKISTDFVEFGISRKKQNKLFYNVKIQTCPVFDQDSETAWTLSVKAYRRLAIVLSMRLT